MGFYVINSFLYILQVIAGKYSKVVKIKRLNVRIDFKNNCVKMFH